MFLTISVFTAEFKSFVYERTAERYFSFRIRCKICLVVINLNYENYLVKVFRLQESKSYNNSFRIIYILSVFRDLGDFFS